MILDRLTAWHYFVKRSEVDTVEVSLNSSGSIKLIELIWKTMIGSLEWIFWLPIPSLLDYYQ